MSWRPIQTTCPGPMRTVAAQDRWRRVGRCTGASQAAPASAGGRRDPRVVVVAKPAGGPLAGRARLRPVLARLRVRRAEIPDVRLHEPDGYECRSAA